MIYLLGSDAAKNREEIAKFSKKDAEKYAEYEAMIEKFARFADAIFIDDEPFFFTEIPRENRVCFTIHFHSFVLRVTFRICISGIICIE
jgi:hypothetical protein